MQERSEAAMPQCCYLAKGAKRPSYKQVCKPLQINQLIDQFDQPIWSTLCRSYTRRHIVAQIAGDPMSAKQNDVGSSTWYFDLMTSFAIFHNVSKGSPPYFKINLPQNGSSKNHWDCSNFSFFLYPEKLNCLQKGPFLQFSVLWYFSNFCPKRFSARYTRFLMAFFPIGFIETLSEFLPETKHFAHIDDCLGFLALCDLSETS